MDNGLVQIYTGDGKGKTTAAFGQAIRGAGRGMKVAVIQFLKGTDSGEVIFLKNADPAIEIHGFNSSKKFTGSMNSDEMEALRQETIKGFKLAERIVNEKGADMLVLDEITHAINLDFIDIKEIEKLIGSKPKSMEIILTGRGAPEGLIDLADLVTEMKKIKHPFDAGIKSRTGIEK